jgi:hypothetical protein
MRAIEAPSRGVIEFEKQTCPQGPRAYTEPVMHRLPSIATEEPPLDPW